jgi:hypothetical protein
MRFSFEGVAMRFAARALLTACYLTLTASAAVPQSKPKPLYARSEPLPAGFNQGDVFPTVALPSAADGHPISLAEFRGKKVIVNIFASW